MGVAQEDSTLRQGSRDVAVRDIRDLRDVGAPAGFEERFMRRYDQRIPPVTFHPDAKALVVIGLHADRRWVAKQAREAGLKVFLVDPEDSPVRTVPGSPTRWRPRRPVTSSYGRRPPTRSASWSGS
ncbi:hypothetical protein [Streptomyces goshikiensis]|uniref:hypothetical protein n=1 Tax=Streptomyces goshikiensis TaxID=1942 RepID=UPI0036A0D627